MAPIFFLRFFLLQGINSETSFGGVRFAALDVAFRKYCRIAYVGTFRFLKKTTFFLHIYDNDNGMAVLISVANHIIKTPICLWHVYRFSIMNEHLIFAAWLEKPCWCKNVPKSNCSCGTWVSKEQNPSKSDIRSHKLFPSAVPISMNWSRLWNDIFVGRFAAQVFVKCWPKNFFWAKLEETPPFCSQFVNWILVSQYCVFKVEFHFIQALPSWGRLQKFCRYDKAICTRNLTDIWVVWFSWLHKEMPNVHPKKFGVAHQYK